MSSQRLKKTSTVVMSGPSIAWSKVDYNLTDFINKSPLPQVVKVKKDASKSAAFKNSVELILHESKALRKIEACVVSEGKTFVLPYDCPAKVCQLTKAEEYRSLGDLRNALPKCRFFLVTRKPNDQQLQDIERGEVLSLLTIVFKKTLSGSDVFTCERKKLGVKIEIEANAKGGFAPMGTTAERKISDFVHSTFPVDIGLTESTLTNKAFASLNDLISQSKNGLIRLTKLFTVDTVIASSLGKKKTVYSIPKELGLTVTASKALLLEDSEHQEFCRKLHEDVDKASIETHLSLVVSFGNTENEVLQWSYSDESAYEEVVPLAAGKAKNSKDKKTKEAKAEKVKVEKSKSNVKSKTEAKTTSSKQEDPEDPVEDEAGYLVPAELLRAQREVSMEDKLGEGKERSSIGIQLGRFMDKVKGKKDGENGEEPQEHSATMPATSNTKKPGLMKNKAKTMGADELSRDASTDDLDGPAATSPKDKEVKKRDKGKKAGAKLRHKLGKSKAMDDDKLTSQTSASSLPSSAIDDEIDDEDMYVIPLADQLGTSPSKSLLDRQLPELPPEDLYDEINPVAEKTFKIPKDLSKLSTNDISEILRSLNMGEHVPKFRNEQIDGGMFKALDDGTLGALGVADPVQRLKIKKLLKGWRPNN